MPVSVQKIGIANLLSLLYNKICPTISHSILTFLKGRLIMPKQNTNKIQSIERAVSILDYLENKRGGERLTVISKDLGLNKSTAFGIISTLESLGLLTQNSENERYRLGTKLIEYGMSVRSNLEVIPIAKPHIERFLKTQNETVQLALLSLNEVVLVEKFEGSQTVQIATKIGERYPVHCSASGKVLLAFLPEAESAKILNNCNFVRNTVNTIVSRNVFKEELRKAKEQMYALDLEEGALDRCCISAPLLNSDGTAVAAISLTYPTQHALHQDSNTIQAVVATAMAISRDLGYRSL